MNNPPYLKQGDKIGIVAPSGVIESKVIEEATIFITKAGFIPVFGDNILNRKNLFAGSDEERSDDFNKMIFDNSIKAIWCARGGYGAMRIINNIDFEHLTKHPKWIIGFSDITVFHSALNNKYNLNSIHGEMPNSFPKNIGAYEIIDILQNNINPITTPYNSLNKTGKAIGKLIGGNLTIIHNLIGTDFDFNPDGKILFIEEIGEYDYHIDRMIQSMKLSKKLDNLAGLIVGQFSNTKDGAIPFGKTAYEIIHDALSEFKFPILFNFPSGHSNPNLPLIIGAEIEITIDKKQSILKYK